ncbi:GNAT family N-acetyltransferase [Vibrio palustris]|uniref:Ribosomal-protein-serine acetyltransferase n=1 Tax=Vibrio palustris TaxID=1918946 RepID=A0A1R4B1T2_9VIBR|nr:GNAT family protein [Vibrio palustris]SJL82870.1 Ribosomal-protein-serine acetyltransferase [Vibrio palustris]
MVPDFNIVTQRLMLKLIAADEGPLLAQCIRRSPSLHQWIDWCHAGFSEDEAERFITATRLNWVKSEAYGFGVYHKHTQEFIGMVALNEFYPTFNMASLGYWIADEHQQQGYGKEALSALIEFSFAKLRLTRLEIVCDPNNTPSHHLAKRCGAQFEVIARNRFIDRNRPRDGAVYAVIP